MKPNKILTFILTVLRIGFGLFFLYTAISKIPSVAETAEFLTRCDLLPEWCSLPLAYIGIGMEAVIALCFLGKWLYRGATLMGTVMATVFFTLFFQAWIRGLTLSCNCLGDIKSIENYPYEIFMRFLLLAGMLLLVWDSRRYNGSPHKTRNFDFSEI